MNNKLNPTFALLACAILIWSASLGLSSYKAKSFEREHRHEKQQATEELPPEISKLEEEVKKQPGNNELRLALSRAFAKYAFSSSQPHILMRSVSQLTEILQSDPKHAEALHDIAMICFRQGIVDKALVYFPRYIEVRPNDIRAKTNFALLLVQSQNPDQALSLIEEIEKQEEKYFPAYLAKVLAHKAKGEIEKAKEAIKYARSFAPDQEGAMHLDNLEQSLEKPAATNASANVSPAMAVDNYFRSHPIVGNKLQKINWPSPNVAHVLVADFPVEQMPEFAKQKFLASMKSNLQGLPEKISIEIRDFASNKVLIETEVGN